MNIGNFKTAIIEARDRAETLSASIVAKGNNPNADELSKIRAETAALIVEIAGKRAKLLPVSELGRAKDEIVQYGTRAATDIGRTMQREIAKGAAASGPGPVDEAVRVAVAGLDAQVAILKARLELHELSAWLDACDKLDEMGSA